MISRVLSSLLLFVAVVLCSFSSPSDVKLVLIGLAMNPNEQPLSSVVVQLEEVTTQKAQTFVTNVDGHFYFKLQNDKSYRISLLDAAGQTLDVKLLSTVNKDAPEIIHMILKGDVAINNSLISEKKGFAPIAQPLRAKPNTK